MPQRWRGPVVAVATALLVLAVGADISLSRARRPEGRRELHRQEMQVKRARRVTRRILHDRRASDVMKQQARELDQLLAERERMVATLENLHREFMEQHRADLDELGALWRRAVEIDTRLREGRKQVLETHKSEVAALITSAERAEELLKALTEAYAAQKRAGRRSRRDKAATP